MPGQSVEEYADWLRDQLIELSRSGTLGLIVVRRIVREVCAASEGEE